MSDLLRIKDNKILYNGVKMEAFIPPDFFKRRYIEEIGSSYFLFGIFETFHYENEDDDRSKAQRASLQYPLKFYTYPDSTHKEKIDIGDGEQVYTILTYYRNSVLFDNVNLIKSADNVEYFTDLLMKGKLDMIEYSDISRMFQLCKHYNGIDLAVPASYEEVIVAEFYRDPKDVTRSARFVANMDDFYAKGINEREKVSFTSTFAALTFEDKMSMLTSCINAKNENRQEVVSDIEKVSLGLI